MPRLINREDVNPYDTTQVHDVLSGKAKIEKTNQSDIKLTWDKSKVKRWKPKEGKKYNHIVLPYWGKLDVEVDIWEGGEIDEYNYRVGNCFRTRKKAEEVLKKIKQLLNAES